MATTRKINKQIKKKAELVAIVSEPPNTWVFLRMTYQGRPYAGSGAAKCRPDEVWCSELGIEYARVRAERDLLKKIKEDKR